MERVSDSDRNAAIKAVEAALADGRIVQADRDQRVGQLRSARTPSELEMITHDLAYRDQTWATYTPPPEAAPPPSVAYGPPQTSSHQTSSPEVARLFGTRRSSKASWVLVPVIFIFLISGSMVFGVLRAIGGSDDRFDDPFFEGLDDPFIEFDEYDGPSAPPQLFQAFRAVIYPGYASLDLPAERTGKRAFSYYYDGELGEPSKGQSTDERFDLVEIDPAVMIKLVRKAKKLVEDPTTWYVIINKAGPPFDNGAWFTAYASNDFSETGYLEATLDGTIVNRYVTE